MQMVFKMQEKWNFRRIDLIRYRGNGQAVSMNVVTDNNGYYNFNNVLRALIKYPFKYQRICTHSSKCRE